MRERLCTIEWEHQPPLHDRKIFAFIGVRAASQFKSKYYRTIKDNMKSINLRRYPTRYSRLFELN